MKCKFYRVEKDYVKCTLCPHECEIKENQAGICQYRKNINGQLINENYGKIAAIAIDPIEKKPLKKFESGKNILSVGFLGCNFRCLNCQNYHISMQESPTREITVNELINVTINSNTLGIAFTYNEPLINYEFIFDVSKALKEKSDKKVVIVTNGFINEKPLMELLPYIDAMNIDLKSFNDDFYKKICNGKLLPVQQTIKLAKKHCHVEVTTLVIPGLNDSEDEIIEIAKFISNIDEKIPLHLSAYYPKYKLNHPPTKPGTLYKLQGLCQNYLIDVFLGNI